MQAHDNAVKDGYTFLNHLMRREVMKLMPNEDLSMVRAHMHAYAHIHAYTHADA